MRQDRGVDYVPVKHPAGTVFAGQEAAEQREPFLTDGIKAT
jgi:hypothetical protein